ncbi:hypothetical protein BV22DRAFT_1040097 [Leucogyrophana mollusca]|uniref:Uncharacterized protein n=1 Tax=Leucogyrophana mollusca TaxID=85980 RepID=A0ACB8B5S4_9AGAM|nr:hypothetical protein BV22DRAFT_1040097 [Leucogyrophana mollusca]
MPILRCTASHRRAAAFACLLYFDSAAIRSLDALPEYLEHLKEYEKLGIADGLPEFQSKDQLDSGGRPQHLSLNMLHNFRSPTLFVLACGRHHCTYVVVSSFHCRSSRVIGLLLVLILLWEVRV